MEAREQRLARVRARRRDRLASETAEEREIRLSRRRVRDRAWHAAQSSQAMEARLQQMRTAERSRVANETVEERDSRLHQLRLHQHQRILAEAPEETETRLRQYRLNQQQRIASETQWDTEARRQRDRISHRQQPLQVLSPQPLLHQSVVHSKMRKFHSGLAGLQVSACITCNESFPGMTVRFTSVGSECVRCFRDKHSPKMYSSLNNMNPGPVPQELTVRILLYSH